MRFFLFFLLQVPSSDPGLIRGLQRGGEGVETSLVLGEEEDPPPHTHTHTGKAGHSPAVPFM